MKQFITRHYEGKKIVVASKYTNEDTEWLKKIIIPLNKDYSQGALERINVFSKYEKRFGRKPTVSALKCWIGRIKNPDRDKVYQQTRREKVNNYSLLNRLKLKDPEILPWAKNIIKTKLHNKITPSTVKNANILKEFNKKFNKNIGPSGIYVKLYRIQKSLFNRPNILIKKQQQEDLVAGSQYVVSIPLMKKYCGFEKLGEVQQFLKDNLNIAINQAYVYEKKNLNIKCDIRIK